MKINKEILDSYVNFSYVEPHSQEIGYAVSSSDALKAMKEAQIEAIKELIDKVFYSYSIHPNYSFELFKGIALELIKEIES